MKKVKDFYYKLAKQENYPARSVYKLEAAQKKYGLITKRAQILDLGCYPGSWTLYAAEEAGPEGLVVGIDIEKVKTLQNHGGAKIHTLTLDVDDPEALVLIKEIAPSFDVVLSDMAPRTTGYKLTDHMQSIRLAQKAFLIAGEVLKARGNFYCKVFQGEDFPQFIDEVRRAFEQVRTVKPQSSRSESSEMFVLGVGFRRENANPRGPIV